MAVEPAKEGPEDAPVEELLTLGGVLEFLADRITARRLLLVTDSPRVVGEVVAEVGLPIVLATTKDDIQKDYAADCETILQITDEIPPTLEMLEDIRQIIITAFLEGSLGDGDDVLCLAAGDGTPVFMVNFSISADPAFKVLRAGVEDRVELEVFEMMLRIGGDLVRKGREGKPVGTMFILGGTDQVLERSRQVVMNPFQGHTRGERYVLRPENIETIKEYAMLDGAIIVSDDGYLEAAGRYVLLEPDAELASGLGGRHLAAASVTKKTKAIAIVVSSSGVMRVYKDGQAVLELEGF